METNNQKTRIAIFMSDQIVHGTACLCPLRLLFALLPSICPLTFPMTIPVVPFLCLSWQCFFTCCSPRLPRCPLPLWPAGSHFTSQASLGFHSSRGSHSTAAWKLVALHAFSIKQMKFPVIMIWTMTWDTYFHWVGEKCKLDGQILMEVRQALVPRDGIPRSEGKDDRPGERAGCKKKRHEWEKPWRTSPISEFGFEVRLGPKSETSRNGLPVEAKRDFKNICGTKTLGHSPSSPWIIAFHFCCQLEFKSTNWWLKTLVLR